MGDNVCNIIVTAVQHSAAACGGQFRTLIAISHQAMLLRAACIVVCLEHIVHGSTYAGVALSASHLHQFLEEELQKVNAAD
eukprot:4777156-Ditylum_brightwellii.AAC.1